jgi:rhodanese-related sulfurtransferase
MQQISHDIAKQMLETNHVQLLDMQDTSAYNVSHIPGAIHLFVQDCPQMGVQFRC